MFKLTDKVHRVSTENDAGSNGKVVNQYRLLAEAGRGTYCRVTWAEDAQQRCHAIKVFSKPVLQKRQVALFDKAGASTVSLKVRIDEELRILATLSHPNIVALVEVIDDPDHEELYVVLEGLSGGQLMSFSSELAAYSIAASEPSAIRRHWGDAVDAGGGGGRGGGASMAIDSDASGDAVLVFQEALARFLVLQLFSATAYLHQHGVVHKDLKPDNIFLSLPIPVADARLARSIDVESWPSAVLVSPSPLEERTSCSVAAEEAQQRKGAMAQGGADSGSPSTSSSSSSDLNALLQRSGLVAKLGDFNTATISEQPDCFIYDAEGTQQFTPPECFEGHSHGIRGKPRDVWSLGVVLFTMLFGHCPFWEPEPIILQLTIMEGNLTVPAGIVSAEAEELLRALLCKEPLHRPSADSALQHPWTKSGSAS